MAWKFILLVGTIIGFLIFTPDPDPNSSVRYKGNFDDRDVHWSMFIERLFAKNSEVTDLTLNSRGGDYLLGARLAGFVADKQIPVFIPDYCEGPCVPVCLVATKCLLGRDAKLVFRPMRPDRVPPEEYIKTYVEILTNAGLPPMLIRMMLNPQEQEHEFNAEDIATFKLIRKP